jgi:transcription elongation factor GreA
MIPLMAESMKDRLIRKFEDEIQTLDRELKLELPREIKRARELGDLRENAEYHAAKERQRLVESRISLLKKRVSEIALINIDRIPTDRVGFGSTLHVVESTGEKLIFQLVMPEDADAAKGLISTTSPIGRAFLNRGEGDSVKVTTPGGTREFEIVRLQTIHDDASHGVTSPDDRAV